MNAEVSTPNQGITYNYILSKASDAQGNTCLHLAASYNRFMIAKRLLEKGADPRVTNSQKRTPLHEACHEGNLAIAKLLIDSLDKRFDAVQVILSSKQLMLAGFVLLWTGLGKYG